MLNTQAVAAWHVTPAPAPKPEKLVARFYFVVRSLPSPKSVQELEIKYTPNNTKASLRALLMTTCSELIVQLDYINGVSGET